MQICLNAPPLFRALFDKHETSARRRRSLFRPGCRAVRLRDFDDAIHFLADAFPVNPYTLAFLSCC